MSKQRETPKSGLEHSILRRAEADTSLAAELATQYEELLNEYNNLKRDFLEQATLLERLQQQAPIDDVTGLANIFSLEAEIERSLAVARRHHRLHALLVFSINDYEALGAFGSPVTTGILTHMARLLRQNIRPTDIAARLREGTFAVLLNEVRAEGHAHQRAQAITEIVQQTPCVVAGRNFALSASSGVKTFGQGSETPSTVLSEAQHAMAQAKPALSSN